MKFYLDTASVKEIKEAASLGLLDGVTTNPSLVAKEGRVGKIAAGFAERFNAVSTVSAVMRPDSGSTSAKTTSAPT